MPGVEGARAILGAIIGAGLISMLIAPLVSKLLRFFPPVVTGTIIAIIGISLMRVSVGWAMGGPAFLAQRTDVPKLVAMVDNAKAVAAAAAASGAAVAEIKLGPTPMMDNPSFAALDNMAIAGFVLVVVLLLESGVLLTAVAAVVLNLFFNGARGDTAETVQAAKAADAH